MKVKYWFASYHAPAEPSGYHMGHTIFKCPADTYVPDVYQHAMQIATDALVEKGAKADEVAFYSFNPVGEAEE